MIEHTMTNEEMAEFLDDSPPLRREIRKSIRKAKAKKEAIPIKLECLRIAATRTEIKTEKVLELANDFYKFVSK